MTLIMMKNKFEFARVYVETLDITKMKVWFTYLGCKDADHCGGYLHNVCNTPFVI